MSIFSKWFKHSQSDIEKELEEMYSQTLSQLPTGMTLEQSREEVRKIIKLFKEQAITEGTAVLPDNFGDLLIQSAESGDINANKIVDKARKEGATDEDIREFWNLSDLERRMVIWSENTFRHTSFLQFKEDVANSDEAVSKIRKMFPMYGDPNDTKNTLGEDRPLPQELRGRVDKYRLKFGASYIIDKVKQYTTYNAYVRDEIRKGNL